jgi:hypothetical protein
MVAASGAAQLTWDDGIPSASIVTSNDWLYAASFESSGFMAECLELYVQANAGWNLEIKVYSFPDNPQFWHPESVDWSSPVVLDTILTSPPTYLDGWAIINLPSTLPLNDITWVTLHQSGPYSEHLHIWVDDYPTPDGSPPGDYFHSYLSTYPIPGSWGIPNGDIMLRIDDGLTVGLRPDTWGSMKTLF